MPPGGRRFKKGGKGRKKPVENGIVFKAGEHVDLKGGNS